MLTKSWDYVYNHMFEFLDIWGPTSVSGLSVILNSHQELCF